MLSTATSNETSIAASKTDRLLLWTRQLDSNSTTITSAATGDDLSNIVRATQGKILPPVIAFAGAVFLFAIFVRLVLTQRVKAEDSATKYRQIIILYRMFIGLLILSTGLIFGVAIASTEAVGAMRFILSEDAVVPKFAIEAGGHLLGLQWATFAIQTLFSTWMTAKVLKVHGNFT